MALMVQAKCQHQTKVASLFISTCSLSHGSSGSGVSSRRHPIDQPVPLGPVLQEPRHALVDAVAPAVAEAVREGMIAVRRPNTDEMAAVGEDRAARAAFGEIVGEKLDLAGSRRSMNFARWIAACRGRRRTRRALHRWRPPQTPPRPAGCRCHGAPGIPRSSRDYPLCRRPATSPPSCRPGPGSGSPSTRRKGRRRCRGESRIAHAPSSKQVRLAPALL